MKQGFIKFYIVGMFGLMSALVLGQDHSEPIYSGPFRDFAWDDLGQTLKFGDGRESKADFYTYSALDGRVRAVAWWTPLDQYTILYKADPQTPILDSLRTGQRSVIYQSPNHQFMVYVIDQRFSPPEYRDYGGVYGVAVTDLIRGETRILKNVVIQRPDNTRDFKVLWSGNSSAFVINANFGNWVKSYYITNFSKTLKDVKIASLDQDEHLGDVTVNLSISVYDIDFSGDHLLVDGYVSSAPGFKDLILINMADFTYRLITTGSFQAASFGRPDYTSINFITPDGIFNAHLQTGVISLRNATINLGWVSQAEFSPDGKYIALSRGDSLYVVEFESP